MPIYKDVSSLELVTYTFANGFTFAGGGNLFADGVDFILEKLDAIPEEDVTPVKHAHWIVDEDEGIVKCSNPDCLEEFSDNGETIEYSWSFCPNCGAKMDEKETEE